MLRVAMDTNSSRTQGIREYVDHRKSSAHKAKAQAGYCKSATQTALRHSQTAVDITCD